MNTLFDQLGLHGSVLAITMLIWPLLLQYFQLSIRNFIDKYSQRFLTLFYPYIQITFNEFPSGRFKRSEAYSAIETYLAKTTSMQAKRLKADLIITNTKQQPLSLSLDDYEEVTDVFNGVKFHWASGKYIQNTQTHSYHYPTNTNEKRYYKLTFHKCHRQLVLRDYLNRVLKEGREIELKNRLRKLYTNSGGYWSHLVFRNSASFQTLAMDPVKKQEIIDDLTTFRDSEEFYNRIGRAWKRGYLLYGPPGTGKSTLIAAMANFLGYDVYELELTAVKDNTELKRLLVETTSKSIIAIEDIDCSIDLSRQLKKDSNLVAEESEKKPPNHQSKAVNVTLSGLLNSIDGLWSACGGAGERLIVFTTNHVEKLDHALIRPGRMDRHIEMSYCGYEAFKGLAKGYLHLETHDLFETIRGLLEETEMTPADVAEHLMPKTSPPDPEGCLKGLIAALEKAKEEKMEEEDVGRRKYGI